jgi:hypothetical protein
MNAQCWAVTWPKASAPRASGPSHITGLKGRVGSVLGPSRATKSGRADPVAKRTGCTHKWSSQPWSPRWRDRRQRSGGIRSAARAPEGGGAPTGQREGSGVPSERRVDGAVVEKGPAAAFCRRRAMNGGQWWPNVGSTCRGVRRGCEGQAAQGKTQKWMCGGGSHPKPWRRRWRHSGRIRRGGQQFGDGAWASGAGIGRCGLGAPLGGRACAKMKKAEGVLGGFKPKEREEKRGLVRSGSKGEGRRGPADRCVEEVGAWWPTPARNRWMRAACSRRGIWLGRFPRGPAREVGPADVLNEFNQKFKRFQLNLKLFKLGSFQQGLSCT